MSDYKSVVLKNAELLWAKLDEKNPASPFGTPIWEVQVRTRDKAQAEAWKKEGVNMKPGDDDEGIYYYANVKKKAIFEKTGDPARPVVVVDGQLMPLDGTTIGNGSIGNVQVLTRPYDVAGKKGISVQLKAIQVSRLVEYSGGGAGLAFEALGETEIAPPATDGGADSLWD